MFLCLKSEWMYFQSLFYSTFLKKMVQPLHMIQPWSKPAKEVSLLYKRILSSLFMQESGPRRKPSQVMLDLTADPRFLTTAS